MPFTRPSLATLTARIRADVNAAFAGAGLRLDATLRRTVPWVMTGAYAVAVHVLYGAVDWLSKQILPTTADADNLEQHAAVYGMTRNEAVEATGTFVFTGVNTTAIPIGTQVVREDGALYETTAVGTISGGEAEVAAVAVVAGDDGNIDAGTELSLASPITGIDTTVTAETAWSTGADEESTEALRDRLLDRIQNTPQGGAEADYDQWMRDVTGVFRTLIVPNARGAGTVDGYFLHEEGAGIGIPTGPQVTAVQTAVDLVRPVTADFLAAAPTTTSIAFTLSITPDTAETQDAVEAALDALYLRKALSGETIYVSDYWAAASAATGIDGVDIASPSADATPADGVVYIRGAMTYT
jgi:uncharacterized phage protein gp47/JayE